MKIVVHDYGGYPFPIQLSRSLAKRGHRVFHVYCRSLFTTPRAGLDPRADDPPTLDIRPIRISENVDKYSYFKRWQQEREYGRLLRDEISAIDPDVVLSGNAPLDAQHQLQRLCRQRRIRFVFWLQDILSIAALRILRTKYPGLGHIVGNYYIGLERAMLRASDAIVLITDDFRTVMEAWKVPADRQLVIENWAPLEEMPRKPKSNAWSTARALDSKVCFIYTGTLGMKHNPSLLLQLADSFRDRDDIRVVVMSQGMGADWLREQSDTEGLENLLVLDYCDFDVLPDVMATADVLVALLEPDAGVYSVPSKVLSYLCAGRPILLAVPDENLAARIVRDADAGLVADPADPPTFVANAHRIIADAQAAREMGRRARVYAEEKFDIEQITDRFIHALAN